MRCCTRGGEVVTEEEGSGEVVVRRCRDATADEGP